uniref:Uncharacterized protein n=1 Tax=Romanomermis culicivorax TaxID=13658 RepID=A0A915KE02_ROMCU
MEVLLVVHFQITDDEFSFRNYLSNEIEGDDSNFAVEVKNVGDIDLSTTISSKMSDSATMLASVRCIPSTETSFSVDSPDFCSSFSKCDFCSSFVISVKSAVRTTSSIFFTDSGTDSFKSGESKAKKRCIKSNNVSHNCPKVGHVDRGPKCCKNALLVSVTARTRASSRPTATTTFVTTSDGCCRVDLRLALAVDVIFSASSGVGFCSANPKTRAAFVCKTWHKSTNNKAASSNESWTALRSSLLVAFVEPLAAAAASVDSSFNVERFFSRDFFDDRLLVASLVDGESRKAPTPTLASTKVFKHLKFENSRHTIANHMIKIPYQQLYILQSHMISRVPNQKSQRIATFQKSGRILNAGSTFLSRLFGNDCRRIFDFDGVAAGRNVARRRRRAAAHNVQPFVAAGARIPRHRFLNIEVLLLLLHLRRIQFRIGRITAVQRFLVLIAVVKTFAPTASKSSTKTAHCSRFIVASSAAVCCVDAAAVARKISPTPPAICRESKDEGKAASVAINSSRKVSS